ncbi:MAG: UDP-2,3-diacylglucosamine hydrolase [Cellvibrionaceae bacterium]
MDLFISDLHLSPERPNIFQAFFDFLEHQTRHSQRLYILGDLFDAWVGDDDDTPKFLQTASAIQRCVENGTEVFFMRGNRDFLLGEKYAGYANFTLLEDPAIIELPQGPALLMHGDTLCREDTDYLAFRKMVRDPHWQQNTLAMPLDERRALADNLRSSSQSMNSLKAEDIMDVSWEEVRRVMSSHKVRRLIHGHTHRPGRHHFTLANQPAERIVLGDWHSRGWYLQVDEQGLELRDFDIAE